MSNVAFIVEVAFIVFAGSTTLAILCANLMLWKISRAIPARKRESNLAASWKYRQLLRNLFPKSKLLVVHDLSIAGIFIGIVVMLVTLR